MAIKNVVNTSKGSPDGFPKLVQSTVTGIIYIAKGLANPHYYNAIVVSKALCTEKGFDDFDIGDAMQLSVKNATDFNQAVTLVNIQ